MARTVQQWKAFGGQVHKLIHKSTAVKTDMTFSVFLPPAAAVGRVPALYWLSGLTCTDDNFMHKAGALDHACALGMAIICPDTSPRGAGIEGEDATSDFGTGAGFYLNASKAPWSAHYHMYDYVTQELPELCESHFPITDVRSISGHSMGGHGALVAYLKNPGMYEVGPWGRKAFSGYLESADEWKEWDATELALHSAVGEREGSILIDQGDADAFLEGELYPQDFQRACAAAKIPLTLRMQPGYDHSYYFISSFIGEHMKFHADALAQKVPHAGASTVARNKILSDVCNL